MAETALQANNDVTVVNWAAAMAENERRRALSESWRDIPLRPNEAAFLRDKTKALRDSFGGNAQYVTMRFVEELWRGEWREEFSTHVAN